MGIFNIFKRKAIPVIGLIAALNAGMPKQANAEFLEYLKKNDPHNMVLLVQKETNKRRQKFRALKEQLTLKETHFLDFQFRRLAQLCDSMNLSKAQDYKKVDSMIRAIADEINKIGDSLDVRIDLRGLLRLKIHHAEQDIERLERQEKLHLVVKRYFGLYSFSHHLGFGSHKRKFHKLWQKYSGQSG